MSHIPQITPSDHVWGISPERTAGNVRRKLRRYPITWETALSLINETGPCLYFASQDTPDRYSWFVRLYRGRQTILLTMTSQDLNHRIWCGLITVHLLTQGYRPLQTMNEVRAVIEEEAARLASQHTIIGRIRPRPWRSAPNPTPLDFP